MRWALCAAQGHSRTYAGCQRRVARASRGAGVRAAAVQCCLRLAALTGFEVSVGAFALGSSADGMLNLNAMGTSVMDAETGLSLVEVIVIVWREDG